MATSYEAFRASLRDSMASAKTLLSSLVRSLAQMWERLLICAHRHDLELDRPCPGSVHGLAPAERQAWPAASEESFEGTRHCLDVSGPVAGDAVAGLGIVGQTEEGHVGCAAAAYAVRSLGGNRKSPSNARQGGATQHIRSGLHLVEACAASEVGHEAA